MRAGGASSRAGSWSQVGGAREPREEPMAIGAVQGGGVVKEWVARRTRRRLGGGEERGRKLEWAGGAVLSAEISSHGIPSRSHTTLFRACQVPATKIPPHPSMSTVFAALGHSQSSLRARVGTFQPSHTLSAAAPRAGGSAARNKPDFLIVSPPSPRSGRDRLTCCGPLPGSSTI